MPDPGVNRSPVSHIPRVVVSSVVRSSHQGESHGGVYLVDFRTGDIQQVIDWDDPTISWEGRGADRGLRGIATHQDRVYLAASDEIFVYDTAFQLQGSFRNRYLKHTHEICIADDRLYATSGVRFDPRARPSDPDVHPRPMLPVRPGRAGAAEVRRLPHSQPHRVRS